MSPANPRRDWIQISRQTSRGLALAVTGMAGFQLLAWLFKPSAIAPDSFIWAMKANAALALVLLGSGLLLRLGRQTSWQRALAAGCSVLALAIGLVTLVEYGAGWTTGFDTWLGVDSGQTLPGRMALQTALVISMCAVALLTYGQDRGPAGHVADASLVAAGIVLQLMITGYFYDAPWLYDVAMRKHPSTQSGVVQFGLWSALVIGRTGHGVFAILAGYGVGSAVARVLIPLIVVLPVIVGRLRLAGERLGWYSDASGLAVFATAQAVLFAGAVYAFSRYLNRADQRYQEEHERRRELERYVAVCAWTRRVRYENQWLSIETFLERRFGLVVTHGMSEEALAEQIAELEAKEAHRHE